MRYLIFLSVVFFTFQIFGNEDKNWSLNGKIGGGYDSNVVLKTFKQQGGDKVEKGGEHYNFDLSYQYNGESYDFDISNVVEWIPNFNRYSRVDQIGSFSTYKEYETSSLTSGLSIYYSSTDFDSLQPYTSVLNFFSEFFYDHSIKNSSFISINIDYQYGIAEIINYLRGFSFGIEGGFYHYIKGGKNYIMISWKGSGYFYDPVEFNIEKDSQAIEIESQNRYLQSSLTLKTKFYTKKFQFSFTTKWHYIFWIDDEKWEDFEKIVTKKRVDNLIDVYGSIDMKISKHFSFNLDYGFQYNFSSLGQEKVDYIDWGYDRYYISGGFIFNF